METRPTDTETDYCLQYFNAIHELQTKILVDERKKIDAAAARMAAQIEQDKLIYVYGPGGHANIITQEVFFRAGGLAHINAILDEGTLLSNGALRSIMMERTPGYGRSVIANEQVGDGDLVVLVSAYGVNTALIDAAMEAQERGAFLIGLNSHEHAVSCPPDHPARHSSKKNLQDVVDIAIDTKVPVGDAVVELPGVENAVGPVSTLTSVFAINCVVIQTIAKLSANGGQPDVWRSVNVTGGAEANEKLISRLRGRLRRL